MKVYKLVAVIDGQWESFSNVLSSCYYDLGRETVPEEKSGPLAAFVSIGSAVNYAGSVVEIGEGGSLSYKLLEAEAVLDRRARGVWSFTRKVDRLSLDNMPFGTVLCRKITPLSVVADLKGAYYRGAIFPQAVTMYRYEDKGLYGDESGVEILRQVLLEKYPAAVVEEEMEAARWWVEYMGRRSK